MSINKLTSTVISMEDPPATGFAASRPDMQAELERAFGIGQVELFNGRPGMMPAYTRGIYVGAVVLGHRATIGIQPMSTLVGRLERPSPNDPRRLRTPASTVAFYFAQETPPGTVPETRVFYDPPELDAFLGGVLDEEF